MEPINEPVKEPRKINLGGRIIPNILPRPYIINGVQSHDDQGNVCEGPGLMGQELIDFLKQCHLTDVYLMLTGGPLKRRYLTEEQINSMVLDHHVRPAWKQLRDEGLKMWEFETSSASMYDADMAATQAYLQAKQLIIELFDRHNKLEKRIAAIEAHLGIEPQIDNLDQPGPEYFDDPDIKTPEQATAETEAIQSEQKQEESHVQNEP